MLFSWVGSSLMEKGAKQPILSSEDLLPLTPSLEPNECSGVMWREWNKEIHIRRSHQGKGRRSLFRVIFSLHGGRFFLLALLKLSSDTLGFVAPLILKHLVEWLSLPLDDNWPPDRPMKACDFLPSGRLFGLVAGLTLGLSCLLRAIITSQYNWRMGRMQCELRASIMCLLYRKSLSVSSSANSSSRDREDGGKGGEDVSTLMSVDAGRVVNLFVSCNEIWGLPFQLIIALVLLYLQVRWAFLAGLGLSIILIPINRLIATRIVAASTSMMKFKDKRLQLISELLKGMRSVKMMAWEVRAQGHHIRLN